MVKSPEKIFVYLPNRIHFQIFRTFIGYAHDKIWRKVNFDTIVFSSYKSLVSIFVSLPRMQDLQNQYTYTSRTYQPIIIHSTQKRKEYSSIIDNTSKATMSNPKYMQSNFNHNYKREHLN